MFICAYYPNNQYKFTNHNNALFKIFKPDILNSEEQRLIQNCLDTKFTQIIYRLKCSDYGVFNNNSKYDDMMKFIIYFFHNQIISYNKSINSNGNSYEYVSRYFNDNKLNINNIIEKIKTIKIHDNHIICSIAHHINKFTITQDIDNYPDKFQLNLHYNNINLIFTYYTNFQDVKYGSIHVQKFQINNEMEDIQDFSSDYE